MRLCPAKPLRPPITYGKPGATLVHPITRTGTTSPDLDLFPIFIYI
jgi:hypothetical protein